MQGKYNDLKALILEENECACYVFVLPTNFY